MFQAGVLTREGSLQPGVALLPCCRCCLVSFCVLFALLLWFPCCPFCVVFRVALFPWLSRCPSALFPWLLCCPAALFFLLPLCFVFLGGLLPCCPCCLVSLFAPLPFCSCCLGALFAGGAYSHTLPIRVCAAQRGRDFEAPEEWGIHFRGVF